MKLISIFTLSIAGFIGLQSTAFPARPANAATQSSNSILCAAALNGIAGTYELDSDPDYTTVITEFYIPAFDT